MIEFLFGKDISVNVIDNDSETPLLWACCKANNVDNVTVLLRHGADICIADLGKDVCASHYATKFVDVCIIEFLIDKGISVKVMDNETHTAVLGE